MTGTHLVGRVYNSTRRSLLSYFASRGLPTGSYHGTATLSLSWTPLQTSSSRTQEIKIGFNKNPDYITGSMFCSGILGFIIKGNKYPTMHKIFPRRWNIEHKEEQTTRCINDPIFK